MINKIFFLILLLVSLNSYADVRVTFSGVVSKGSINSLIKKVEKAIKKQSNDQAKVITVSLNSPGGDIRQALRFVDYVQSLHDEGTAEVNTLLSATRKSCESSCTILFTAGLKRIAHPRASFGFHSPKYESGAPEGMSPEYIEGIFRSLWLDYVSRVDSGLADQLLTLGYLDTHKMNYIKAQDLYPGYVTDLTR